MDLNDKKTASAESQMLFDVRDFARTAQGSHREQLELRSYESDPLASETINALRTLSDFEASTMQHLRNVLVTATHKDARVTAFLVTWAFEKFWIADALAAIIEANGQRPGSDDDGKRRHDRLEAPERRGPVRRAIDGIRQGVPVIAVHMTSGLVDDWILRAAYDRVKETTDNTALADAVTRITSVKARHTAFFVQESTRRLAESPRAARLTSSALNHAAWPIGAVTRSDDERGFFERYTFGSDAGRARADAIAEGIAELPGIDASVAHTVRGRLVP